MDFMLWIYGILGSMCVGYLILFFYLQKQKKLKISLNEQILQNEKIFALKEQELTLKCQFLENQLYEASQNHANLTQTYHATIESLKAEYETKLNKQEQILQELSKQHHNNILAMQESYEHKTQELLKEQERRFHEQNLQKEESIKEILSIERQKQEALIIQKIHDLNNQILEENTKQFQAKQSLSLKPLCEEIERFKNEVAHTTKENREKQIALHTEIKHLRDMSMQVSKDANNLANAMRGDSKIQGQWGEIVLERLLEKSGLELNREYYTQLNIKNESNENLRPDVVIQLPNERFVVIDSKVSLKAYEKFANEEEEQSLNAHIESVKNHIKSLSTKRYQDYLGGAKLDFVILFMPVEGAYTLILKENLNLFLESYERGVILASPSTLMVILRLIYNIWSNEAKDKNIEKILAECLKLIKKFDNFTENMDKINRALESAKSAYDKADIQIRGKGSMASCIKNLDEFMCKITPQDSKHTMLDETQLLNTIDIKETLQNTTKSNAYEAETAI